jgi:hypothetical protein
MGRTKKLELVKLADNPSAKWHVRVKAAKRSSTALCGRVLRGAVEVKRGSRRSVTCTVCSHES